MAWDIGPNGVEWAQLGNNSHVYIVLVRYMSFMRGDILPNKQSMKCPVCDNEMVRKRIPYFEEETGLNLGSDVLFDADVCEKCGEAFFTEESSKLLDLIFMDAGLWGIPTPPPTIESTVVRDNLFTDFITLGVNERGVKLWL